MTAAHREQMRMLYPDVDEKVFLIRSFGPDGGDLADPIGLPEKAYERVRGEIAAALPELVAFLRGLRAD
jgi:hypothetical protein